MVYLKYTLKLKYLKLLRKAQIRTTPYQSSAMSPRIGDSLSLSSAAGAWSNAGTGVQRLDSRQQSDVAIGDGAGSAGHPEDIRGEDGGRPRQVRRESRHHAGRVGSSLQGGGDVTGQS